MSDIEKALKDYNDGEFHYKYRYKLEQLVDALEDALRNTQRKLRDMNNER